MKKDKIKIVLIAVVLVLIFVILLFKSIREKGEKVVSFKNKDEIVSGRDSAIDKTKFFANTQNGNDYDIEAKKIVNIDENIFQLYEISADIKLKGDLKGDKKLNISADKGKYDFNKKELDLSDNVSLVFYEGLEFSTSEAQIFLEEGRIVGNKQVQAQGEIGNIDAGSFAVEDFGKKVIFYNGVNLDAFFTQN